MTQPAPTPATSVCGAYLDDCTCRKRPILPRSPQEMRARHEAAVARAYRSGWPTRRRSSAA
ncbi:hypothetical protein [Pseudonocardia zijingensis]|uniref:Uncharacterized protein n=1 Tax=Pseudonocardia zijingensis TaxID=153376 RepID=A0ABP3YLB7_9PSEU